MDNQKKLIDINGKPFKHFERGVIYTAKVCRRGLLIEKRGSFFQKNKLSVFSKAVKIND